MQRPEAISNQFRGTPVSVAAGDFNGDDDIDLVTANGGVNGLIDDLGVVLGNGNGKFQPPKFVEAGDDPVAVAVADLNGDGSPDIVAANNRSDDVSVLLGRGDGTFHGATAYAAGEGPAFVVVANLNGDNYPDIITANPDSNNVSVLLGMGSGAFQAPLFATAGDGTVSLAVAFLDADDFPDLVTANRDSNNVGVLLGNGDGTFQAPAFLTAGDVPVSVAAADLDSDDIVDLAIANRDSNDVSVILGNGNGTFQSPTFYRVGIAPTSIAVQRFFGQIAWDHDDDPKTPNKIFPDVSPDIVTANSGSNNVSVLLGNSLPSLLGDGDGSFRAAVHFPTGNTPVSVIVPNLNGAIRTVGTAPNRFAIPIPDIVTANRENYNATVLLGRFIPASETPTVDFQDVAGVSVADKESDYFKVKQFCTPVDKNGEGIPDRSIYLTCYEAKRAWPVRPQVITEDQFGELELDVRKQRNQLCLRTKLIFVDDVRPTPTPTPSPVPTAAPNPAWPSHQYELYRVKQSRGSTRFQRREVSVDDLFLNESLQVKKPDRLGLPTGTDGKGILNPVHHLDCYLVKAPRFKKRFVQVSNDFGTLDLTVRRPNMLCAPSLKEIVPDEE